MLMNTIVDFFGVDTNKDSNTDWKQLVVDQHCPFTEKKCYKIRKSQPDIAIGTCTVKYQESPVIICPNRLLERNQIFIDCLHLLTGHEPGNELHKVSEIRVPGGNVDYFLVSVRNGKVRDFVGIELQTLDTTGTVWPARQRFLSEKGFDIDQEDIDSRKSYGMNWKMTAKTILVQLHHKIQTFEALNKHLVLVVQDNLLKYMSKEFSFDHLESAARTSDPMHFHSYSLGRYKDEHRVSLSTRLSTDTQGIEKCLGLKSEAKVELDVIVKNIEQKLSYDTLLTIA